MSHKEIIFLLVISALAVTISVLALGARFGG